MGFLKDLAQAASAAKSISGGNFIKAGRYTYIIKRCFVKNGHKGQCIIAELLVDKSERTLEIVAPNSVGATVSFILNRKTNESADGLLKAFILAVFGYEESEIDEEDMEKAIESMFGDANCTRGMLIENDTFEGVIQKGKNAGMPITKNKWIHVAGQKPEDIKARRNKLDGIDAKTGD